MGFWDYLTVLHELAKLFSVETYLEVGIREGASLCAALAKEPQICAFAQDLLVEQDTFLTPQIIERISRGYSLRNPATKLYLFDAWTYAGAEGGKKRVSSLLVDGFHLPQASFIFVDGDSKMTLPRFFDANPNLNVDLAFIDGFHDDETALSDMEGVLPHVKIIALHDMFYEGQPLLPLFKQFVKVHGLPYLCYGEDKYDTGVAFNMKRRL